MLFPPNSRYHLTATAKLALPDGSEIVHLQRRFVPQPGWFAVVQEHAVVAADRLDNLAARYLGDPEQFWRLCDANRALQPAELTQRIGQRLKITLPDGITGAALV